MIILQEATSAQQASNAQSPLELAFEVEDVEAMQSRLGDRAAVQKMGWGNAIETTDLDGARLNLYRWR